jgi:predicted O-methyltransferase YrrM
VIKVIWMTQTRSVADLARPRREAALRRARRAVGSDEVSLDALYRAACATTSDIHEHLPVLADLAAGCDHVTEFGTRMGVSTTALLAARPGRVVSYDRVKYADVDLVEELAGPDRFEFRFGDTRTVAIEPTDLLFIDTRHDYFQLAVELARHAGKVRRWIVLHDTTTFGTRGETPGDEGLWPAVEELVAQQEFVILRRFENNNGLTILERRATRFSGDRSDVGPW